MLNSAAAAWLAQAAFWVLIVLGWSELSSRARAIVLGVWLAGFLGRGYLPFGDALFTALVAVLAIILVLAIFKRDLRI